MENFCLYHFYIILNWISPGFDWQNKAFQDYPLDRDGHFLLFSEIDLIDESVNLENNQQMNQS